MPSFSSESAIEQLPDRDPGQPTSFLSGLCPSVMADYSPCCSSSGGLIWLKMALETTLKEQKSVQSSQGEQEQRDQTWQGSDPSHTAAQLYRRRGQQLSCAC